LQIIWIKYFVFISINDIFAEYLLPMITERNKNYLLDWIEKQQSWGKYTFSLGQLRNDFPEISENALNQALARLSKKGRILSVYKGFYLIITPEYAKRGVRPPIQFIDELMNHAGKPYYVGLLSAAAFYGSAHHQPQEFFVVTNSKQTTTCEKNLRINYITKKIIPVDFIRKIQTESGYVNVSSPPLTAADLIYYNKQLGGIERAGNVLIELSDQLNPEDFSGNFLNLLSLPTIQRMGFIFERILLNDVLADALFDELKKTGRKMFRQPLASDRKSSGFPRDKRWQVIINTNIEIEE